VDRLGLGLGLWLGPHAVGRLGSGMRVSASFRIFALTAGECPRWGDKLSGGEMSGGVYLRGVNVQGEMSYTLLDT